MELPDMLDNVCRDTSKRWKVVCNCVNVGGLWLDVIWMSLARRSQDWHAQQNDGTQRREDITHDAYTLRTR
jgi:hypothetical protein